MLNKRLDTDPIMLDDIDPNSEWVVESHLAKFELDFDIDAYDLRWDTLDANPLVAGDAGADPNIAGSGGVIRRPCHAARASTRILDVPEEFDSEEFEPDVDVEHPISSSGVEFDD